MLEDLRSDKEDAAEAAADACKNMEDDRCVQFTRRRVLQAYDQFASKVQKALDPPKKERVQEALILQHPVPTRRDENSLFIGISPGGAEWVYYLDQNKDLDQMLDIFLKHWQRWRDKKSPEDLQRILRSPQGEVEQQFVELVKAPTLRHQGNVFRFVHR